MPATLEGLKPKIIVGSGETRYCPACMDVIVIRNDRLECVGCKRGWDDMCIAFGIENPHAAKQPGGEKGAPQPTPPADLVRSAPAGPLSEAVSDALKKGFEPLAKSSAAIMDHLQKMGDELQARKAAQHAGQVAAEDMSSLEIDDKTILGPKADDTFDETTPIDVPEVTLAVSVAEPVNLPPLETPAAELPKLTRAERRKAKQEAASDGSQSGS